MRRNPGGTVMSTLVGMASDRSCSVSAVVWLNTPLWLVLAIAGPQLQHDQVGPGRLGELRQPVHAASFPDPVAGAHVIRMQVVAVPGVEGLPGGEVPTLARSHVVEPL